jgi:hypothetical protein
MLTILKGSPAPPLLTPPTSPLDSELPSGSEILLFDDGGALVYHMPDPNAESEPASAPCMTRQLSFDPLTPIMESSESPELPGDSSFVSWTDVSEIHSSLSDVSLLSPLGESVSYFDLVLPLPPSKEHISYFAELDANGLDSDTAGVDLPSLHPECQIDTVEIKAPTPSRAYLNGAELCRLLNVIANENDTEVDSSEAKESSSGLLFPQQYSASGASSPYGPITPIGASTLDTGLLASNDSSYSSANGSDFRSYHQKRSPFSSLLYVGKPPTPFNPPLQSSFDPFGPDDETLPPFDLESAHVGVDIMKELLAADDNHVSDAEPVHFVSPFDQIRDDILQSQSTTQEIEDIDRSPTLVADVPNVSSTESTRTRVDVSFLTSRVMSWVKRTQNSMDDFRVPLDALTADGDPYDEAADNQDYEDDSDSEDDDDYSTVHVLEHDGIKYTITGELGQGTYGQVVLARTSIGEEVAIKICGKGKEENAPSDLRRSILNERNILVRISAETEPFLTQPLACFHDEDNVYFVLVSVKLFCRHR